MTSSLSTQTSCETVCEHDGTSTKIYVGHNSVDGSVVGEDGCDAGSLGCEAGSDVGWEGSEEGFDGCPVSIGNDVSEGSELGFEGSEVGCGAVSEGSLVGSQIDGSELGLDGS